MTFRFAVPLTFLFCTLAHAGPDCMAVPPISDETSFAVCPDHYLLSGVKCEGRYCDDITPICCRYLSERYQPSNSIDDAPSPPLPPGSDNQYWTAPYSEEGTGLSPSKPGLDGLVSGLRCSGDYCDDLQLRRASPGAKRGGTCVWLDPTSEEDAGAQCSERYYVNDIKCAGSYCDELSLQCCSISMIGDYSPPAYFYDRRCLTLPRTGRGFSIAAQVTSTGISSDLSSGRPDFICPAGTAMSGLQCSGDYCSYLNATCCAYGYESSGSQKPKFRLSVPISEEHGNRFQKNRVSSENEFMVGVRCSGNYCDNVEAVFMRSPTLLTTKDCSKHTVASGDPPATCPSYQFATGIECSGSYCSELTMTCCGADFRPDNTWLTPFIRSTGDP